MFIDASALTALMTSEADAAVLLERLRTAPARLTSPVAVWETAIATARILDLPLRDAKVAVRTYLETMDIDLVAVPPEVAGLAIDAFDAFGKGRHPARLNLGDCFAYACSRHFGQPLLFKGDDFTLTDIEPA